MLTMSFRPRNSATDIARPSAADRSANVGNASPALNPRGNGALRAQIGLAFAWLAAPALSAATDIAADSNHMTLALIMASSPLLLLCAFNGQSPAWRSSVEIIE